MLLKTDYTLDFGEATYQLLYRHQKMGKHLVGRVVRWFSTWLTSGICSDHWWVKPEQYMPGQIF